MLAKTGVLIPFQFSATDGLMIVATNMQFQFCVDGSPVLNPPVTITNITQGTPTTVTAAAHGYTNGDVVFIAGVVGETELNNNFYTVSGVTTNTFNLQDSFGNNIDSTTFGAYTSGGVVSDIYTLPTPYFTADLPFLRYSQVGDLMYIDCINTDTLVAYPPQKLIRTNFTSWTVGPYVRINDPFTGAGSGSSDGVPTAITQANPAVVTELAAAVTALAVGDIIYMTGIVGMTELNGNFYKVGVKLTGTTFSLQNLDGTNLDTTGFTAFVNSGTPSAQSTKTWPGTPAFTSDGRLAHAGSLLIPQGFWDSRLPSDATGGSTKGTVTRYDDFTTGTDDTFAAVYQFAPVNNEIDPIQEMIQFQGNMGLLGPSALLQVYGATPGQAVNPTAIGTLPAIQGTAHIKPLVINWDLVFVDANKSSVRGLQFNLAYSAFEAKDYNLDADHVGSESPMKKMVFVQLARVDIIWMLREDGVLFSLTFNNIENISAWARHYTAGGGNVIDIGVIHKPDGTDQLWLLVEHTINGQVYTSVEYASNWPIIPPRRKFYTGKGNKTVDQTNWENATFEALKTSTYLDMSVKYDGAARGVAASANLTLSALTGNITITASQAVFVPADADPSNVTQLWGKYNSNGSGGGQCVITNYVSPTVVNAQIVQASVFDNLTQAAGNWFFAVNSVNNLGLFEGLTVNAQVDGADHPPVPVVASKATLQNNVFGSVIQFGFGYLGMAITQNLELGGSKTGPGASKPRNVKQLRIRMVDTIGLSAGTDEYNCGDVVFRTEQQRMNWVSPPFSGMKKINIPDSSDDNIKQVVLIHDSPTPCTIVNVDIEGDTSDPP